MTESKELAVQTADDLDATLNTLAKEITTLQRKVGKYYTMTFKAAIEAGVKLKEASALCPYGTWKPWLEENTPISTRTAQVYMQMADNADVVEAYVKERLDPMADNINGQKARVSINGALQAIRDANSDDSDDDSSAEAEDADVVDSEEPTAADILSNDVKAVFDATEKLITDVGEFSSEMNADEFGWAYDQLKSLKANINKAQQVIKAATK